MQNKSGSDHGWGLHLSPSQRFIVEMHLEAAKR